MFVCILYNIIILYWYWYNDGLTLLYKEKVYSCHNFYHNSTHSSYNSKLMLASVAISHFVGYQLSGIFKECSVKLTSSWLMIVQTALGTVRFISVSSLWILLFWVQTAYISSIVSNITSWLKRPFHPAM